MADEYQVARAGRAAIDAPAPARRTPPASDNPEVARAQIEATRARMSETIDEIEDVLLEKKERLREKLDVLAPVRERPLQAVGVLFGVGLALGLLTGGGDDEEEERPTVLVLPRAAVDELEEDDESEEVDEEEEEAWARAELWEDRAQRLLRIARAQEEELEVHRAREARDRRRVREWEEEEEEGSENFFDRIRDVAAERLSGIIGEITERMSRG